MQLELLIENKGILQAPAVLEGVTWTTERRGSPGKLTFTVLKDEVLDFTEGNPVRLSVDGVNLFYGFVFSKKRDREQSITVTAYDQIRYLQNRDTIVYTQKTASELLTLIAGNYGLRTGEIEKTRVVIPHRVEDNTMLLDMLQSALDLELQSTKQSFVLFDQFGRLTLKSLASMKVGLLIDEETGENFNYTSSIDEQTYNRVKLLFENKRTGKRDIHVVQHVENINNWGVLQYFDTLKEGENGDAKAAALLELYTNLL